MNLLLMNLSVAVVNTDLNDPWEIKSGDIFDICDSVNSSPLFNEPLSIGDTQNAIDSLEKLLSPEGVLLQVRQTYSPTCCIELKEEAPRCIFLSIGSLNIGSLNIVLLHIIIQQFRDVFA